MIILMLVLVLIAQVGTRLYERIKKLVITLV